MLLKTVKMHKSDVVRLLKNANPLSTWGAAIRLHLQTATMDSLDELIIELRSQARDNSTLMREILGGTVYDKLILS